MSTADIKLDIFRKIDNLPEQELLKINDLLQQYLVEEKPVTKKQRQFGSMKGLVIKMADDFDAPMEDFKEYMQ